MKMERSFYGDSKLINPQIHEDLNVTRHLFFLLLRNDARHDRSASSRVHVSAPELRAGQYSLILQGIWLYKTCHSIRLRL